MHNNFGQNRAMILNYCCAVVETINPQNSVELGSLKYLIKPALTVSQRKRMLNFVRCVLFTCSPVQILCLYLLLTCDISVLLFQASCMHSKPMLLLNYI